MSIERDQLKRLVEQLPESEVASALRYLQFLNDMGEDPLLKKLMSAPIDDEPETEEERQGAEEAKADLRAGRTMSTEELKRELGI